MKPGALPVKGLSYYRGGNQAHRVPAPTTGLGEPDRDLINGLYQLVDGPFEYDIATGNLSRPPAKIPSNARRPGETKE